MSHFEYRFSSLCGVVFQGGNLCFAPDGTRLVSPVGNRLSVFDLQRQTTYTVECEADFNIVHAAVVPPHGVLALVIDEMGRALLINLMRRVTLARLSFGKPVTALAFAPDGRHFATAAARCVKVWRTPPLAKAFNPFVLVASIRLHMDEVTGLSWSPDSSRVVSASADMTARLWAPFISAKSEESESEADEDDIAMASSSSTADNRKVVTFSGLSSGLVAAFFYDEAVFLVGQTGGVMVFEKREEEDEESPRVTVGERGFWFKRAAAAYDTENDAQSVDARTGHIFLRKRHAARNRNARVESVAVQAESGLMVVGFDSGVVSVYQLPDVLEVHELSVSSGAVSSVALNASGEWVALGCAAQGQLLVWDWQAETYVLRQQGQLLNMSCMAWSPDGQFVCTGADDGRVKVWNAANGFCLSTFRDHRGAVAQVVFSPGGRSAFSASADGTVRAFDLTRYRNFRTFVPDAPAQFSCVAVDPSGEVVCAGAVEPFDVFVWSVQTGRAVDVLNGHTAPVSCVAFSPTAPTLASGSWDGTVRLWSVFARKAAPEELDVRSDVLALAWRPDGKRLAVATLSGAIEVWDPAEAVVLARIDGAADLRGPRLLRSDRSARTDETSRGFTSLCFSADGQYILGGGRSLYVCIYHAESRALVRRFEISRNRSLDGTLTHDVRAFASRAEKEAGVPLRTLQEDVAAAESLPGARSGALAPKRNIPVRTRDVAFSPSGRAWGAVTTEGLLVYSRDDTSQFSPFELDETMDPAAAERASASGEHTRAILIALHLREPDLTARVFSAVPPDDIALAASSLPPSYLEPLLRFIAAHRAARLHLEFDVAWIRHILFSHAAYLKSHGTEFAAPLKDLLRHVRELDSTIGSITSSNIYTLSYLSTVPRTNDDDPDTIDEFMIRRSLDDEDEDESEKTIEPPVEQQSLAVEQQSLAVEQQSLAVEQFSLKNTLKLLAEKKRKRSR